MLTLNGLLEITDVKALTVYVHVTPRLKARIDVHTARGKEREDVARLYPWQCKVISRQDRRRWEKDGDGKPVQVYAQSETSYGEPAGLFGVSDGHHPELFIPEVTKIPEVWQNDEQNAQTYAQSQQHRALERQLRAAGGGTISPSTQADGDMIVKIGTLDVGKYDRISTDITTADVIITDERIAHIRQRHPGDWEQYGKHIEATIIDPDYILRDSNPATAICIKRVIVNEEQKHLRTTLRLHTSNDEPNRQNSVLTFQKINKKEFGRLSRNQNVVYKRE